MTRDKEDWGILKKTLFISWQVGLRAAGRHQDHRDGVQMDGHQKWAMDGHRKVLLDGQAVDGPAEAAAVAGQAVEVAGLAVAVVVDGQAVQVDGAAVRI